MCLTGENKRTEEICKTELNGASDRLGDKLCRSGLMSAERNFMWLGQEGDCNRTGVMKP